MFKSKVNDMFKSMSEFVLCNGISIVELNPENFALRNDYIDNLFATAYLVINKIINPTGIHATVVRGFLSDKFIKSELSDEAVGHSLIWKHGKGLAIEITWEGFTYQNALTIASNFVQSNDYVACIITDSTLQIYRKTKVQEVRHKAKGSCRKVFSC